MIHYRSVYRLPPGSIDPDNINRLYIGIEARPLGLLQRNGGRSNMARYPLRLNPSQWERYELVCVFST